MRSSRILPFLSALIADFRGAKFVNLLAAVLGKIRGKN